MKPFLRCLIWLVAFTIVSKPSFGMSVGSWIDGDPSVGVWGGSVTELDWGDWTDFYVTSVAAYSELDSTTDGILDEEFDCYEYPSATAYVGYWSSTPDPGNYYVEGDGAAIYDFSGLGGGSTGWEDVGTSGDGPYWIPAICDEPDGESTEDDGFLTGGAPLELFKMTLYSYPGYADFSGRSVTESYNSGGWDTCWDGSVAPSFGSTDVVDVDETYHDTNGHTAAQVASYRSGNKTPCGFTVYQDITINCPDGTPYTYTTNEIDVTIGTTTVTTIHSGVGGTHSYP